MQKILVIRFSSIGDIVLTTPVLRCLYKQLGAEVHFLTKKQFLPLVGANPYLHKVFTIEKDIREVLLSLKKERYDCIVDLHRNLRSWRVKRALGVRSLSFDKLNVGKWLLVHFKWNLLPNVHIVDRYLKAIQPLGALDDGHGLDYFFPKDYQQPEFQPLRPQTFVVFAIGAAHRTKRLPVERMIDICRKTKGPILLIGGETEADEGAQVAAASGDHVQNLCGQLDLHGSAALIRDAALVIAPDTGMMHLAAAFQKRILVVWGSTVPAFGMGPYFGKNGTGAALSFEVAGLSCRPCSKLGFGQCPKGHFRCMTEQNTGEIARAASP